MSALQHGAGLRNIASTSRRHFKSPNPHRHLFTQSSETKRTPIRTALYTTAFILSSGLFAVYYYDARSALHRYFITPVVRNLFDAETGHKIAVKSLKSGLAPRDPVVDEVRLKAKVSLRVYAVINPYLIRLHRHFTRFGTKRCQIQLVLRQVSTRMGKLLTVCERPSKGSFTLFDAT